MPGAPCVCRPSRLTVQLCDAVRCRAGQLGGPSPGHPALPPSPGPPTSPQVNLALFCKLCHPTMQMFSAEELLSFLTRVRKQGSLSEVFPPFQTLPRVRFLLGFLTTCGQRFIYPDVRNGRNEQSSSKGALDLPMEPDVEAPN